MTDRGTLAAMGAVALAALSAVGGVGVTLWRGGGRYAQIIGGMDALKREGQKLRQDFERHEDQDSDRFDGMDERFNRVEIQFTIVRGEIRQIAEDLRADIRRNGSDAAIQRNALSNDVKLVLQRLGEMATDVAVLKDARARGIAGRGRAAE